MLRRETPVELCLVDRVRVAESSVIKAAFKWQEGSNYIIADVGRLPELHRLAVHSKRSPAFVLPDEFVDTSGFEQQIGCNALDAQSSRDKMRPDIMTVEMTPTEYQQHKLHPSMHQLSPNMPAGCARRVWIVEGGYCSDTRYVDKLHENQQQHQTLEASLKAYGYGVPVLPITLSFYGTIPDSAIVTVHTLSTKGGRACFFPVTHMPSFHAAVTLRRKLEGCFKNRRSHRNRST